MNMKPEAPPIPPPPPPTPRMPKSDDGLEMK